MFELFEEYLFQGLVLTCIQVLGCGDVAVLKDKAGDEYTLDYDQCCENHGYWY